MKDSGPPAAALPAAPVRMGRALWISTATMASRVLGLVREQVFAALLGAGRFTDAFVTAFRISNLLRDLFAEGALSAGFVPTFADYDRNRGRADAWRLANAVVGLVLAVVGLCTLLGILFAPQIVRFMAPGFAPEQVALSAHLARIMMPFLLLVSLAAVAMGILNAQARFTAPALAPALFNVATIAVGVALWVLGVGPRAAVVGWSVGTLLGGLLQLLAQVPSLWRLGYRPRPALSSASLREPGVRRIGRVVSAAVIGLSAVQVNIFVSNIFASHEVAAVSWLNYAFRLMQLPLGVFGVAIATVAGAGVAQRAAAKDLAGAKETLGAAMRLVAFLNVPSAVGLMVLASPIIGLIYEHRAFKAADTAGTAEALVCYAVGLYGYSAVKVLAPAFYALDQARVPVLGSILGMIANVALNVTLYPVLGYRGVALGTSLAATANFAVLAIAWKRLHGGLGGEGIYRHLARVAIAAGVLALVAWGTASGLARVLPERGLARQLALALLPIAVAGAAYLAAARLLGLRELDDVLRAVKRRTGRRATGR
jgi:putative peptidoglycan lipid II flippase